MKKIIVVTLGFALSLFVVKPIFASQKDLVNSIVEGCESEISTLCKDIAPGRGQVLACLFSHKDKLSGKCEYALYDAAPQLERIISGLSYLINECKDDLVANCQGVKSGEGRLLNCLKENEEKVSDRCKHAQADVIIDK